MPFVMIMYFLFFLKIHQNNKVLMVEILVMRLPRGGDMEAEPSESQSSTDGVWLRIAFHTKLLSYRVPQVREE